MPPPILFAPHGAALTLDASRHAVPCMSEMQALLERTVTLLRVGRSVGGGRCVELRLSLDAGEDVSVRLTLIGHELRCVVTSSMRHGSTARHFMDRLRGSLGACDATWSLEERQA